MKEESKRQTVSETEILNPHWNLLTVSSWGGMPGRHSLKVTGSAIESKIDNAIWLEGGSCGFQSRSKEQGIILLLLLYVFCPTCAGRWEEKWEGIKVEEIRRVGQRKGHRNDTSLPLFCCEHPLFFPHVCQPPRLLHKSGHNNCVCH